MDSFDEGLSAGFHIGQSQNSSDMPSDERPSLRKKVETIFEFSVAKPKPTLYRGVRGIDGGFRIEKRGQNAKKFRSATSCGSVESLFKFRESVEFYCGK